MYGEDTASAEHERVNDQIRRMGQAAAVASGKAKVQSEMQAVIDNLREDLEETQEDCKVLAGALEDLRRLMLRSHKMTTGDFMVEYAGIIQCITCTESFLQFRPK